MVVCFSLISKDKELETNRANYLLIQLLKNR